MLEWFNELLPLRGIDLGAANGFPSAEGCWSGRTELPAKQLHWQNRCRGFESRPLRHLAACVHYAAVISVLLRHSFVTQQRSKGILDRRTGQTNGTLPEQPGEGSNAGSARPVLILHERCEDAGPIRRRGVLLRTSSRDSY